MFAVSQGFLAKGFWCKILLQCDVILILRKACFSILILQPFECFILKLKQKGCVENDQKGWRQGANKAEMSVACVVNSLQYLISMQRCFGKNFFKQWVLYIVPKIGIMD